MHTPKHQVQTMLAAYVSKEGWPNPDQIETSNEGGNWHEAWSCLLVHKDVDEWQTPVMG